MLCLLRSRSSRISESGNRQLFHLTGALPVKICARFYLQCRKGRTLALAFFFHLSTGSQTSYEIRFLLDYSRQKIFIALITKSAHQQASNFFQHKLEVANLEERVKIVDVICARDLRGWPTGMLLCVTSKLMAE